MAACRSGREKVIEMLLANYKIDLEKRCTVRFDGHIVHGASALWVAAGSGMRLQIDSVTVIRISISYFRSPKRYKAACEARR